MNDKLKNGEGTDLEPHFTTADLTKRYQVSWLTVHRWLKAGRFNGGSGYFQLDDGGYRISKSAIEAFDAEKHSQRHRTGKKQAQPTKRAYHRKTTAEKAAEATRPKRKYTKRTA